MESRGITAKGQKFGKVTSFRYLGTIVSDGGSLEDCRSHCSSDEVEASLVGVGRFRILGGQGLEYSTSCAHKVFNKSVPNVTFLILKSDIIENSRIELRRIVLPVPSSQIKVIFIIILPFNLVHL